MREVGSIIASPPKPENICSNKGFLLKVLLVRMYIYLYFHHLFSIKLDFFLSPFFVVLRNSRERERQNCNTKLFDERSTVVVADFEDPWVGVVVTLPCSVLRKR